MTDTNEPRITWEQAEARVKEAMADPDYDGSRYAIMAPTIEGGSAVIWCFTDAGATRVYDRMVQQWGEDSVWQFDAHETVYKPTGDTWNAEAVMRVIQDGVVTTGTVDVDGDVYRLATITLGGSLKFRVWASGQFPFLMFQAGDAEPMPVEDLALVEVFNARTKDA